MKIKGKQYRVDWEHVGNTAWFLDDALGWFYFGFCLLILASAPSLATTIMFLIVLVFKAWAINWQRKWL